MEETASNYRPISLLSCIGKVFERVVFKFIFIISYWTTLLSINISPDLCTDTLPFTNLLKFYHNICLSLENRKVNCTVFCDISKVFNKVWHRGLLKKLKAYGISGNLLRWFENYLSDRNQRVVLQNCLSEVGNVKGGVPQGSVLGPLLFILYISDITDNIQSLSRLFADDTSLSYSSSNINEIEQRLNSDMINLKKVKYSCTKQLHKE